MHPLSGITVVSLEQAVAAPFATWQLADLGARVIKIERPDGGDFARHYDAIVKGLASYFVWLNRSKESITLDLKRPQAAKVLEHLRSPPHQHASREESERAPHRRRVGARPAAGRGDRRAPRGRANRICPRMRSEEHTSELQSRVD